MNIKFFSSNFNYRYFCTEVWSIQKYEQIYSAILMSLQFIVPLAVLILTNARIAVVVWGKLFSSHVKENN